MRLMIVDAFMKFVQQFPRLFGTSSAGNTLFYPPHPPVFPKDLMEHTDLPEVHPCSTSLYSI